MIQLNFEFLDQNILMQKQVMDPGPALRCIMYAIQSYKRNTTHSLSVTNQMENDLYKSKKGHVSSTWLLAPTLYIPSRITSSTI